LSSVVTAGLYIKLARDDMQPSGEPASTTQGP
jgi:hypothetical protein